MAAAMETARAADWDCRPAVAIRRPASGNGNSQSPAATLPGAAARAMAPAANPAGTPGAGAGPSTSVAGFNGQPYGSGTSTACLVLPVARRWEAPAPRHFRCGYHGHNQCASGQPGRQRNNGGRRCHFQRARCSGNQAPADNRVTAGRSTSAKQGPAGPGSNNQAKGRQGQQGAGGLGLQPNSQTAGGAGGQAGVSRQSGQPRSPAVRQG